MLGDTAELPEAVDMAAIDCIGCELRVASGGLRVARCQPTMSGWNRDAFRLTTCITS